MMTKDEALKMAIEAFERWEDTYKADCTEVINACKEALEQPTVAELNNEYLRDTNVIGLEQPAQEPLTRAQQVILANNKALEPVAWLENGNVNWAKYPNDQSKPIQLYTHPHQWQGLTDDEIDKIIKEKDGVFGAVVRAVEQALKDKNT